LGYGPVPPSQFGLPATPVPAPHGMLISPSYPCGQLNTPLVGGVQTLSPGGVPLATCTRGVSSEPLKPQTFGGVLAAPLRPTVSPVQGEPDQRVPSPLEVAGVMMPLEGVQQQGDVTSFGVLVQADSGKTWKIGRLYSHFEELARVLGPVAVHHHESPFPSSKGGTPQGMRHALEKWLMRVLKEPQSRGEWVRALRHFLDVSKHLSRVSASSAASSRVSRVPGSRPPPAGQPPFIEEVSQREAASVLLQIVVPSGVSAGELLAVTVPDGRVMDFPVPPGVLPGTTLHLNFDHATGTLIAT